MISDPNHPIWKILRLTVVNGSLLIAMGMITNTWDTEFWVVAAVFGGANVNEILTHLVQKNADQTNS